MKAVIVVYVKSRTALEQVLGSHARSLRTSRDEGEKTPPLQNTALVAEMESGI